MVEANDPMAGMVAADLGPALRRHLADRVPDFMVPAAFVVVDAIPLTPNGKVDRDALPAPDDERPEVVEEFVAPRTPPEQTLAGIWRDVIGIDRVGVHDNFFELGGDSILSLQIVARARAAGLELTVTQLFECQTVAELAAVAGSPDAGHAVAADQSPQTGSADLTPAQHWLLDDPPAGVDHFNQSVLLEVPSAVAVGVLGRALGALVDHHDALRLRFRPGPDGWEAEHGGPTGPVPVGRHDLATLDDERLSGEVGRLAAELQAGLDISTGPVLRAELFDAGPHRPARLLLAVHHLVVDGVSWRYLLEDLWTAYAQLASGSAASLPAKTTPIGQWARAMREYADDPATAATAAEWAALVDPTEVVLPTDGSGANVVAAADSVTVAGSAATTATLLTRAPATFGARLDELLLAALARTLGAWCGRATVCIDAEGHGRDPLRPEVDITRTVGWFTAIAPARLTVTTDDLAGAVAGIVEQLRGRPGPAPAFGALRHLSSSASVRDLLGSVPPRQLSFNYLGRFGGPTGDDQPAIRAAREPAGPIRDPRGARRYLIEVDGSVVEGRLAFTWTYCSGIHERATVAARAARFAQELDGLAAACSQEPQFPASPLDADEVATVLTQLAGARERADR